MTTDVYVMLAFVIVDFSLVVAGLFYLAGQRARRDSTDVRYRGRRRW